MAGAMTMSTKTARDAMTPREHMFSVRANDVLDENLLSSIFRAGFSRIPVLAEGNDNEVIGILFTKVFAGI